MSVIILLMERQELVKIAKKLLTEKNEEAVVQEIVESLDEWDYQSKSSNDVTEAREIVKEALGNQV